MASNQDEGKHTPTAEKAKDVCAGCRPYACSWDCGCQCHAHKVPFFDACWEHQDGAESIRLSFMIRVF